MKHFRHYPMVAAIATVVFTGFYLMVGFSGAILFKENCDYHGIQASGLTASLDQNSLVYKIAVPLYCAMLIPTFGTVYFCAYEAVESKVVRWKHGASISRMEWLKSGPIIRPYIVIGVRLFFIAMTAIIANFLTNFNSYLSLIGAVANAAGLYILPHLCWLKLWYHNKWVYHRQRGEGILAESMGTALFSMLNILIGLGVAIVGTIVSVQSLVETSSDSSTNRTWCPDNGTASTEFLY